MLFVKPTYYKLILIILFALTIIMGVVLFIIPPSIFPDPSWGFQVMRSMQMGGGFNLIIGPNPADLSKNLSTFLSWWSPGQYLVPYFIKSLTGLNTGQASAITVSICNLSALAGFYCFFKKIGFSHIIAAISLVFIVCQQACWIPYAFYNGGEVLLFAFEGWFLYGCVSLTKPGLKLVLFALLSGWIGFICKSSFMWIYLSGLLCIWIRISTNETTVWAWIKKGFWLGLPAIISVATIYVDYLSKGENPASASGGFKLTWETFSFPLASPLLSGFSVDDLFNGLVFNTDAQHFSTCIIIAILLLLALFSLLIMMAIWHFVPNKTYRMFVLVFYIISTLFFGYSFLKQAAISYEGRHFRLIGLLIIPGVIYLVGNIKPYYQVGFLFVCLCIAYSSFHFVKTTLKGNSLAARGTSGLAQQFIDQPSLNYITALDRQKRHAIFVFISTDIGLEILHNRIITNNPYDADVAPDDRVPYLGHDGTIYMLLPASYTGIKLTTMCRYFPGYKTFSPTKLSKNYVLYTAN